MYDKYNRITISPDVCHGQPVVRGLRYPVQMLLDLLSSGMSIDEILDDYEDLEREDLLSVLAFASKLSSVKRMEAISLQRMLRIPMRYGKLRLS